MNSTDLWVFRKNRSSFFIYNYRPRTSYDGRLYFQFVCLSTRWGRRRREGTPHQDLRYSTLPSPPPGPGQTKTGVPPSPSQDRGTPSSLPSARTGVKTPSLPPLTLPLVRTGGTPPSPSPQPGQTRTEVPSLSPPHPTTQGQDGCVAWGVCLLRSSRRPFFVCLFFLVGRDQHNPK